MVLFKGAPDLLDEFKHFLPDTGSAAGHQQQAANLGGSMGRPQLPVGQSQQQHSKKPKRYAQAVTNPPVIYSGPPPSHALPPPKKRTRLGAGPAAMANPSKNEKPGTQEELEFFEKCKRVIGNKTTYNEFLKVLNLFSQEIIEAKVLIERVEPFLGKVPELFDWFKQFVKYDPDEVIYNVPAERPDLDLRTCRRSGHSYRKLPKHVIEFNARFRVLNARVEINYVKMCLAMIGFPTQCMFQNLGLSLIKRRYMKKQCINVKRNGTSLI